MNLHFKRIGCYQKKIKRGKICKGRRCCSSLSILDLTTSERRPALIVTVLTGYDVILAQITSKNIRDNYSIAIHDSDFKTGNIKADSNVRPNRLFTADKNIILYKIGSLNNNKVDTIINRIVEIIKQ